MGFGEVEEFSRGLLGSLQVFVFFQILIDFFHAEFVLDKEFRL